MQWPQITVIVLLAVAGAFSLAKHGTPKGEFNFFYTLIAIALEVWLLSSGGFFK